MLTLVITAGFIAIGALAMATLADSYYRAFASYSRLRREAAFCGDQRAVTIIFEEERTKWAPATVTPIAVAFSRRAARQVAVCPQFLAAA